MGPLRKWIETGVLDDGPVWDKQPSARAASVAGSGALPLAVAQDEKRLQLRAYEMWRRLLGSEELPVIADLVPTDHPALSPRSALLDCAAADDDPRIAFMGGALAAECDVTGRPVARISDLPERSLLGRIADRYLRTLTGGDPIGFEAEFVNQRDCTIAYRGILLPFSRDRRTIDFVLSVISWKELAYEDVTGELLLELNQVVDGECGSRSRAVARAGPHSPAAEEDLPPPAPRHGHGHKHGPLPDDRAPGSKAALLSLATRFSSHLPGTIATQRCLSPRAGA